MYTHRGQTPDIEWEATQMTICEFFKKQFDNARATAKHFEADSKYLVEISGYEKGSFDWFKALSKRYFGGGYFYHYEADGITREQLKSAQEQGFIKYSYYSNWQARQLNQTEYWCLTNKGLKALYKAYQGQW